MLYLALTLRGVFITQSKYRSEQEPALAIDIKIASINLVQFNRQLFSRSVDPADLLLKMLRS